jgi:formate dehydrogenase gamma subunit
MKETLSFALGAALLLAASCLAFGGDDPAAGTPPPAAGESKEEAPAEEPKAEEAPSNDECDACHSSATISKKLPSGEAKSLTVPGNALDGSAHKGKPCVSCHAGIKDLPHPKGQPIPPAVCTPCHEDAVEAFRKSHHGAEEENRNPITCGGCHGDPHKIFPADDPKSPTARARIPDTCGNCHGGLGMTVQLPGALRRPTIEYKKSVHGSAVAAGRTKAAVCTDCHGSHEILPPSNSASSVSKFKVPETCGNCHGKVGEEYGSSVHGTALRMGITRSPSCTDCHGIHTIKAKIDPASSVSQQEIARTTCPQCHSSVILSREFGLPVERVQTYLQSYHGLAMTRGSQVVANCASCHGIHDILPESDPRSKVNPANLTATCGTCHPGAGENFVKGSIHGIPADAPGARVIGLVREGYIILILLVIGGMLAHNLLDFVKKIDPSRRALSPERLSVERLDVNGRIQHGVLAVTFIALALSGFALAFPHSLVSDLFGPGESVRRWVHRVAAIAMTLGAAYHLYYVALTRKGRRTIWEMRPRLHDLREASHAVSYNLGLRKERPQPAHFDYAEKAEYWALIWGTVIMTVTGVLLWFKIFATETLGIPLWGLDLALTIHYYEALLATLAILVWHFYFTIFDPAVYPMNWAKFTGWVRRRPGDK